MAGPSMGGEGPGTSEWISTQGRAVDASIRRNKARQDRGQTDPGTQASELLAATERLGVRGRYIPDNQVWSEVNREDRIHARVKGKRGEGMVAYTDGGLDPGADPKAGWGMTIQSQVDRWEVRG